MVYSFGEYELDIARGSLRGPDGEIALRPQAFSLLRLLIERAPELLSRDEILDQVWGRHALSVNSLPQVIGEIRGALGESAAQPRFIVTKHRRGYQFVGEVERRDAPGDAGDVPATDPQPDRVPDPTPWWRPAALAALAVAAIAAALWFGFGDRQLPLGSGAARPALAVLQFDNLPGSPELDWVGLALADFVGTRLGGDESIRLIPGESVAKTRRQLAPSRSDGLADVTLDELRRLLGADFLVSGSFLPVGTGAEAALTVSARLQNIETGEVIASFSDSAPLSALGELTGSISQDFRRALGIGRSNGAPTVAAAPLQMSSEAQASYFRGLGLLRDFKAVEAIEALKAAVADAPDVAIVRSALAEAYREAGYQVQALQQARLATVAAANAPRRERLTIDALAASLDYDWSAAERHYAALFSFFPDDQQYGYRLLDAQLNAGSRAAAGDTLAQLEQLSVSAETDPRWLFAAATLAKENGQPQEQRKYAELALAAGVGLDSDRLQAAARHERAIALQSLGDLDEARSDAQFASDVYEESGRAARVCGSPVDARTDRTGPRQPRSGRGGRASRHCYPQDAGVHWRRRHSPHGAGHRLLNAGQLRSGTRRAGNGHRAANRKR